MGRFHSHRYRIELEDRGFGTPCHIWQGCISPEGYARYSGKYLHRVALEKKLGVELPRGSRYHVDHLCQQRACINPDHLEFVTNGENIRRAYRFCKRGHEMTEENTYWRKEGWRMCRACQKIRYQAGVS